MAEVKDRLATNAQPLRALEDVRSALAESKRREEQIARNVSGVSRTDRRRAAVTAGHE